MKLLVVHQDFAHHVQSEPIRQAGEMVLFPWPIPLPEGFDRVSTPLIDACKVEAFAAHYEALAPTPAPVNPQPIPEPQEEPDDGIFEPS
jgi:hypothetical protein